MTRKSILSAVDGKGRGDPLIGSTEAAGTWTIQSGAPQPVPVAGHISELWHRSTLGWIGRQ